MGRPSKNADRVIECLKELDNQVNNGNLAALKFSSLKASGMYYVLYSAGIKQTDLLDRYNLGLENDESYISTFSDRWTKNRIISEAKLIKENHGYIPPAQWFSANGMQSFVQAVYNHKITWDQLREFVGDTFKGGFVESRNGMRWRSHPEASLSNYLYSRGIAHKKGERYPVSYEKESKRLYGYYDLHFLADDGKWVDVEVWGEKPNGHDSVNYCKKRHAKEIFNRGRRFLGIDFNDCFSDKVLSEKLQHFLLPRDPYIFEKLSDSSIETTHWSNADELIETCRKLLKTFPDKKFPTEEWLRKRGKYIERPGPAYNTLSVYIKRWLGGIRNLRKRLGQKEQSTVQWNEELMLEVATRCYITHKCSLGTVLGAHRRGNIVLGSEEKKTYQNVLNAIQKRYGSIWDFIEELKHTSPTHPLAKLVVRKARPKTN